MIDIQYDGTHLSLQVESTCIYWTKLGRKPLSEKETSVLLIPSRSCCIYNSITELNKAAWVRGMGWSLWQMIQSGRG